MGRKAMAWRILSQDGSGSFNEERIPITTSVLKWNTVDDRLNQCREAEFFLPELNVDGGQSGSVVVL